MVAAGGLGPATLSVLAAAVLLGALVQSVVGLGLGLVAAPVTVLVAPELMPSLLIALAMVLPCLTLITEHHEIDWRGLAWSLPPRVVGTAGGLVVVARLSERALGVGVGAMVLLAVVLSWRAVRVPVNRRTLVTAGLVSGVTGTATSIGGPPLALLLQHRPPRQIRSTLAIYFVVGAALSLTGLAWRGAVSSTQLQAVLLLTPAVLVGTLLAGQLRRRLSPAAIRPLVLLVCGASALVLLVRSVLG